MWLPGVEDVTTGEKARGKEKKKKWGEENRLEKGVWGGGGLQRA